MGRQKANKPRRERGEGQATSEQREAQRRMVATVGANSVLNRDGLALWRPDDDEFYGSADADAVAADLELLGVRSTITGLRLMPPGSQEGEMQKGREVRVPWSELAALVRWMPSLRESMDELPEDARKVFEFVYLEPRPEGMAVCTGVWACHWLWWTEKQALRMGLMCADCGTDLRAEGSAYRIADAEGRKRMYCGGCCNHGLDALDALAG